MDTNKKSEKINERIIEAISELLTDICEESSNEKNEDNYEKIKPFMSKIVPQITIKQFIERIIKYTKIEESTLILVLIYIDKICEIHSISLNFYNIHKLILASLIIAIKYNEDVYYSNEFYAKVGGINKIELNKLEYEFLILIGFKNFVNDRLFIKYHDSLINSCSQDENEEAEMDDEEEEIETETDNENERNYPSSSSNAFSHKNSNNNQYIKSKELKFEENKFKNNKKCSSSSSNEQNKKHFRSKS